MRLQYIALLCVLGVALPLLRCASGTIPSCIEIAPPEINLTSQKTVVERHIVGDYKELERDAWIVSSVQTNMSRRTVSRDRVLFEAMSTRDSLRQKIREFKDEGAVGETSKGYLKYIGTPKYQRDAALRSSLMGVVDQENQARKTVFQRVLVRSGKKVPSERDIDEFGSRFAGEQRAFAKENDWIQDTSGRWDRK